MMISIKNIVHMLVEKLDKINILINKYTVKLSKVTDKYCFCIMAWADCFVAKVYTSRNLNGN